MGFWKWIDRLYIKENITSINIQGEIKFYDEDEKNYCMLWTQNDPNATVFLDFSNSNICPYQIHELSCQVTIS